MSAGAAGAALGGRLAGIGERLLEQVEGAGRFALLALATLRAARRRFVEREGAVFEVLEPPHAPALWQALRPVSDAWLAAHGGREKSFSLGAFDPAYLARHAIAVVRLRGRIVAFANVWLTADRKRGAVDLMRHDPNDTPNGLMDFLFTVGAYALLGMVCNALRIEREDALLELAEKYGAP